MNISRLTWEVFSSREKTLDWCRKKNLLPSSITCGFCFQPCFFVDSTGYIAGRFRCQKKDDSHLIKDTRRKKKYREFHQSASLNTFLSSSKIGLNKFILLTYCWANDY